MYILADAEGTQEHEKKFTWFIFARNLFQMFINILSSSFIIYKKKTWCKHRRRFILNVHYDKKSESLTLVYTRAKINIKLSHEKALNFIPL